MYLKRVKRVNTEIRVWLFVILLCMLENVFLENSCLVNAESPKACAHLKCKRGDQCVSRKFWCKFPPCPNMLYCSKSRKESLKGPSTCEDVRCSKGFVCLVRARQCRWDEECEQQIARCVSERDFFEGPASCVDFHCPSGQRCILRESLCVKPPCKLLKSCAETKEVRIWLQKCRSLRCLSEYECFLRRPPQNCTGSPCKHTPDCSAKSEEELEETEQCRGWVCPKGEECKAQSKEACKRESCRISRSCHKPLMIPVNTSPSPQHVWRDDIKLSFYRKQGTNSSAQEISSNPLRSNADIFRSNSAMGDGISSKNFEDGSIDPTNNEQMHKLSNLRPSFPWPNVTSTRIIKPTVTSLTTWLNYLKSMTGVDAVEAWVKKADRAENHQEFLEWLESVKDMLGPAAYGLWLEEVRAMTVTNVAFQKWLPPSPTNRSTDSDHLVRQDAYIEDVSYKGRETLPGSEHSDRYRNYEYTNSFQFQNGYGRTGLRNTDYHDNRDLFLPRKDVPATQFDVTPNNQSPQLPAYPLPPPPPWTGSNERSLLYPTEQTIPQQNPPFSQNFRNMESWQSGMNQAFPYQGFDNSAPLEPPYPSYSSNWSFPQSPQEHPGYLDQRTWQNQYYPPGYPQWRQDNNEPDPISPNHRILQSPINPGSMYPPFMENPMDLYPQQNSSYPDTSWMKSFDERYGSSQYPTPENFESYPMAERNFNYPNWPESSLPLSPQQLSKHQDSETRRFSYDNRNLESFEENLPSGRENSYPYHAQNTWEYKEPRNQEDYLPFEDYGRNLYDKNNPEGSPLLSTLSRTHRVDGDPFLSLQDPYIPGNEVSVPQSQYHWASSYPEEEFPGISGTRSPSYSIPIDGARENKRRMATFAKRSPLGRDKVSKEVTRGSLLEDVPGQAMDLPDLWNSRYRHPSNWFTRKNVREEFGNRGTISRGHPAPTNSTSNVLSSRKIVKPQIVPVRSKSTHEEKVKSYEGVSKSSEDYSVENDDEVFPLLLNLQGYVETPSRQVFQNLSNPPKNLTILPVYTINDGTGQNDDDDDYEDSEENGALNFFRDPRYGGHADFPNNLKNAFEVEAALIMQNRTGHEELVVNDMKWDYEDDEDPSDVDLSSYWDQIQLSNPTNDGSSNEKPINSWVVNTRGAWNDNRSENDYYEERVDYVDEIEPDEGRSSDPGQIDIDSPLNHEELSDDFNDHSYGGDVEHKTFKKNRPL